MPNSEDCNDCPYCEGESNIPEKINYCGYELTFVSELLNIDWAQYWIDYYRERGFKVCCTHLGLSHQLYTNHKEGEQ